MSSSTPLELYMILDQSHSPSSFFQNILRKNRRYQQHLGNMWYGSKIQAKNFSSTSIYHLISRFVYSLLWFEYGLARLDRLWFYNSYAIWRENMGKEGVNLQDPRYGFRHFVVGCAREFARRAMVAGIVKNHRTHAIHKMRSVVMTVLQFLWPYKVLDNFEK